MAAPALVDLPRSVADRFQARDSVAGIPHIGRMAIVPDRQVRGRRRYIDGDGRHFRILGIGGLAWEQGLCWLWLSDVDEKRVPAVTVVRAARFMLGKAQQLGERRVFAARDEFPRSEKLLRFVGFTRMPDAPALNGRELWIWQASPQSQP